MFELKGFKSSQLHTGAFVYRPNDHLRSPSLVKIYAVLFQTNHPCANVFWLTGCHPLSECGLQDLDDELD